MVSKDKIVQKFLQLDEYLSLLKKISDTPTESFLKDRFFSHSRISSPCKTVTAWPLRNTRSPSRRTLTIPPLDEAW